jgi:DNA-binding NarL/FixJ family response regulator
MIANQEASIRGALRMFFQVQDDLTVVSDVSRAGELLRDAPALLPDLIFMSWDLPDIALFSLSGYQDKKSSPSINQVKAVIIHSLHNIPSKPEIIVTGNRHDDILPALHSGADEFLYQGEMPSRLIALLNSIQNKRRSLIH